MTNPIQFTAVSFRESLDRLLLKGASVTREQDVNSRLALSGMLDGTADATSLTIIALAAHGNPKSPKGKVAETLSGLQYVKGGDAARKSLTACFDTFDCIAANNGKAGDAVKALIGRFVDKETDAPKGIFALRTACKALVKASMGEEAAEGGEGEGEDAVPALPASAEPTLSDMVAHVAAMIGAAPVSELQTAQDAMLALMEAIETASAAIAASIARTGTEG